MVIPAPNHRIWREIVEGKRPGEFTGLGTKLFISRLVNKVRQNPDETVIQSAIIDLHNYFVEKKQISSIINELENILR